MKNAYLALSFKAFLSFDKTDHRFPLKNITFMSTQ